MKSILLSFLFLLLAFDVNAQNVNVSDANLKAYLLLSDVTNQIASDIDGNTLKIDANNDGEIQLTETNQVSRLVIDPASYGVSNLISTLSGLESFSNLTELGFENVNAGNSLTIENLTSVEILNLSFLYSQNLDLINLIGLQELRLSYVGIDTLEFINCSNLEEFYLEDSLIETLDLSLLVNLKNFGTYGSELIALDFYNNTSLENISLYATPGVSQLDFSQNINLIGVAFYQCGAIDVDFSVLSNLEGVVIQDTSVPIVDLSQSPNLSSFSTSFSPINFLNIKNGTETNNVSLFGGTINYLCADDFEVSDLDLSNINVVSINSYCTFEPGGDYYLVEGANKVDSDFDGCDTNDYLYPNLKFNISNTSFNWTYFTDASGDYSIPLSEGNHTLAPELENPDYFTVSPSSFSVNFPSDTSPYIQDFCITPIGVYNDLEVIVIPLGLAIPGFDANYKIIYKNKGNMSLSGAVEFDYSLNSDVVQFLSAMPTNDSESNNILSWNYVDLAPFETREILVSFSLNTPTDPIFPLNDGDELGFTGSINPLIDDETPSDNSFELKQTVVNSYDPNDIRCLEGEKITPEDVGKYVHYLIRFENLGTANAVNVVVKSTIDATKFDINTLVPIDGSHDYYTRINATNEVEFIFENIQLPFDDANNDGYVVYKIRTVDTLILGDEFSNQAEIYFDFNAPVITNNYTTVVAEDNLSTSDFSLSKIKVYPNPVNDFLNIKAEFAIDAIGVYDIEGRKVLEILQNRTNQLDMSALNSGIYFVKVFSTFGNDTLKIIKK
ncbi:DUF7619 domain-containing protein [Psychroserpens jangbogonensis]|uniref:DUF7619 domain-containing protein n=1 Tax=Psychroserpens jangbogonensis TaxID=1484460 RepID=UPI00053D1534|nr:T9SS type A sorting domain-containing protein [Psychroserpens jangbogonensis]